MEPNWDDVERRLMALKVRQLRELGRAWFCGLLGGASAKREMAQTMASQMRHWWTACADNGGRERVRKALKALEELEG